VTLRQESELERLRRRIAAEDALEGALLLGSFATRSADALSDVDVLVVVADGRFGEAWAGRSRLEGDVALIAWDDLDPEHAEIGGHKWLTRDLVLVECLLGTPSSGVRLAEPYTILVGDASLPNRLERRPAFSRDELRDYASARADAGRLNEIEAAYGRLVDAVRAAASA
jgi:predicted nucleotidyltransferase